MTLSLHNLQAVKRKRSRRVGRGNASGRGTYAGRGQKGQRARSGGRRGLKQRALKQIFQRLPKLGGFKSLKPKAAVITIDDLRRNFKDGAAVNKKILMSRRLAKGHQPIKILSGGAMDRALHISGCRLSAAAREKIITAGGTVES